MAKDAPNFCSEWVSVSVFTLIVPLKMPPPKLDKDLSEMDILVLGLLSVGGQCQVANDAPNFCSGWVPMTVLSLILASKVPPPKFDRGFVIGKYFGTGTFECCGAMPSGQRCSNLLLWIGFNVGFHFGFPIESTGS